MFYKKLQKIRGVIFDVDGVLTDGKIVHSNNGDELKQFNVQDGLGITMLKMAGIKTGIITGRKGVIIEKRAEELKIDFLSMGHFSKLEPLQDFMEKYGLDADQIAYMGDDILDLPILSRVGFALGPSNIKEEVKPFVDFVTAKKGGDGAVREFSDLLLKSQNHFDHIFEQLANFPESK